MIKGNLSNNNPNLYNDSIITVRHNVGSFPFKEVTFFDNMELTNIFLSNLKIGY